MQNGAGIIGAIGTTIIAVIGYAAWISVLAFRRGYRDRAYRGSWYVLGCQLGEPLVNCFVVPQVLSGLMKPGITPYSTLTVRDAVLGTLPVSVVVIPLLLHYWLAAPNPQTARILSVLAVLRWPVTCAIWVGQAKHNELGLFLFVGIGLLFGTARWAQRYLHQMPIPVRQQSLSQQGGAQLVGPELTQQRGWDTREL